MRAKEGEEYRYGASKGKSRGDVLFFCFSSIVGFFSVFSGGFLVVL